jgi:hypothetical protein
MSKSKVKAMDQEIAAEKKRDGKSKESLAKIKKMELEKIKQQEKAGIASVGISTATAIMGAFKDGPTPWAFALAAIMGVTGAMQIANIKKASSGQAAGLESSTAPTAVSVGSRNNAVDVSQSASAGELAYLTGGSGTGTSANDFKPGRAAGGDMFAGTGFTIGERGAEVFTPKVDGAVSPAGSSNGPAITINVAAPISAMDAQSFAQFAEQHALSIAAAVEQELNVNGRTLGDL